MVHFSLKIKAQINMGECLQNVISGLRAYYLLILCDVCVINKDWRIQVAETRTVYCKHVRQVKTEETRLSSPYVGAGSAGN